jgi:foldase protein PrsA
MLESPPLRQACAFCGIGLVLLGGCGGGGGQSTRVAVRIGRQTISSATVERWMSAIAPEHVVPDPPAFKRCVSRSQSSVPEAIRPALVQECGEHYAQLKRRAISLLISSTWIIDEARERGVRVSATEVDRLLREHAVPIRGGDATPEDERLAGEAQAAVSAIRQQLKQGEPPVSAAQIAGYYRRHVARYGHPAVRQIYLAESIPSLASALRLRSEVERGRQRMAAVGLHETVDENHPLGDVVGEARLLRDIFSARPRTLSEVLPYNRKWAFFEVTRVTPRSVQPLAKVRDMIRAHLEAPRWRRTLEAFVSAWRARWRQRTDCRPGFVVQKCSQFKGDRRREDPSALS